MEDNKKLEEKENKIEEKNKKKEEKKVNEKNKKIKEKNNKIEDKKDLKKYKEKRSKKWIVIVVLLLILIALVLLVAYTSITPRMAVNNTFTNLKNGKVSNWNINYDELINVLDAGIRQGNGKMTELEQNCFNSIEWSITGESVENQTATVNVEVTTKNFRQVLLNWIEKISVKLETQEDISNEENIALLAESVKQDNVETITTVATLNLERKGFTWKIIIDENLIDAIYPGLNQVLEVMEQLSSEIDEGEAQE